MTHLYAPRPLRPINTNGLFSMGSSVAKAYNRSPMEAQRFSDGSPMTVGARSGIGPEAPKENLVVKGCHATTPAGPTSADIRAERARKSIEIVKNFLGK